MHDIYGCGNGLKGVMMGICNIFGNTPLTTSQQIKG
jgi:hypothetical protein